MSALVVSHIADLDGVTSAVLAVHYLRHMRNHMPQVVFVDYSDAEEKILQHSQGKDELWVLDISLRNEKLRSLVNHIAPRDFYVFDHHRSSRETMHAWESVANIHFNDLGGCCTADLIWDFLQGESQNYTPPVEFASLVRATHSIDLWIRDVPAGDLLGDVVNVLGAEETFKQLFNEPQSALETHFTPKMRKAITTAHTDRENSKMMARLSAIRHPLLGGGEIVTAVCVGYASDIGEMFRKEETQPTWIGLIDQQHGTLSFRCTTETLDNGGLGVNEVAGYFGGGGHPCASGAPLTEEVLIAGPQGLAYRMESAIKAVRERNAAN